LVLEICIFQEKCDKYTIPSIQCDVMLSK